MTKIKAFAGLVLFFNLIVLSACQKGEKPTADFSIVPANCDQTPCIVEFINKSDNADGYLWDFGDGSTSQEENPSHEYDTLLTFKVTLQSINSNGTDQVTKDIPLDGNLNTSTTAIDPTLPFWEYGGGYNYPNSFRNHHYTFEVKDDNSEIQINLTSEDTDVYLSIYNSLGVRVNYGGSGRTATLTQNLNKGKFHLVAAASERGGVGNYDLQISGNASDPERVPSNNVKVDADQWDTGGGGYNYPFSYRNHLYSFEVTQNNSSLDIIQYSPDSEVSLHLYNSLWDRINYDRGNRLEFIVQDVNAGIYYISAGSYYRNLPTNSKYFLDIEGNISNFKKFESKHFSYQETWTTKGGGYSYPWSFRNHRYILDIVDVTTIDIILKSTDAAVAVRLYSVETGNFVGNQSGGVLEEIIADLSPGQYILLVGAYYRDTFTPTYDLSVVGAINEIQRVNSQDINVTGSWTGNGGSNQVNGNGNTTYEFDITENNSVIDIELQSSDTDVRFWLIDPLNEVIGYGSGSSRLKFIVKEVNEGQYKVVAGTYYNGGLGDFKLSVVGQFANFKKQ